MVKSIEGSPSKVLIIKKLEEKEVLTITDLSNQLKKHKSTILRHIVTLEKADIIKRKRSQIDHRVILLSLTQKGKKVAQLLV